MITMDSAFEDVISACAAPRRQRKRNMDYRRYVFCILRPLQTRGDAHSIEVWRNNTLVGGLYGVVLGDVFFGESMFSQENNASKVALVGLDWQLQQMHFRLIDCQIPSKHLLSLGAETINRGQILGRTRKWPPAEAGKPGRWQLDISAATLA